MYGFFLYLSIQLNKNMLLIYFTVEPFGSFEELIKYLFNLSLI